MTQTTTEPVTLGIDLGGTKIALALVDADGRVLARRGWHSSGAPVFRHSG